MPTTETRRMPDSSSTAEQRLAEQLGRAGDDAMRPSTLRDRDRSLWDVGYFHRGPKWWSLIYCRLRALPLEPKPEEVFVAVALFGLIDVIQAIVRLVVFPFVWLLAWFQRNWAARRGVGYFCPVCHNTSCEPLVQCPVCHQVQGALRPRPGELFTHRCANCGKTSWSILGQFGAKYDDDLVCRDTRTTVGCLRTIRIAPILGDPVEHAVIAGPRLRSKHSTLSHLLGHATRRGAGRLWQPASASRWPLGPIEFRAIQSALPQSLQHDTRALETPGSEYTLARTTILKSSGSLCAVHNLAEPWVQRESLLYQNGYPLVLARTWFYVLDAEQLERDASEAHESPAETLSRMIRVVQQLRCLSPTETLPTKLAILLPIPAGHSAWTTATAAGLPTTLTDEQVRDYLRLKSPALCGVISTIFRARNVRYFAGPMPPTLRLDETGWIADAWEWGIG